LVNLSIELTTGFDRLLNIRTKTGNIMRRMEKYMKDTVITQLNNAVEAYWGEMAYHQAAVAV
jgi:hypothetical protein